MHAFRSTFDELYAGVQDAGERRLLFADWADNTGCHGQGRGPCTPEECRWLRQTAAAAPDPLPYHLPNVLDGATPLQTIGAFLHDEERHNVARVHPSLSGIDDPSVVYYSLPDVWFNDELEALRPETTTSVHLYFKEDFTLERVPTLLSQLKACRKICHWHLLGWVPSEVLSVVRVCGDDGGAKLVLQNVRVRTEAVDAWKGALVDAIRRGGTSWHTIAIDGCGDELWTTPPSVLPVVHALPSSLTKLTLNLSEHQWLALFDAFLADVDLSERPPPSQPEPIPGLFQGHVRGMMGFHRPMAMAHVIPTNDRPPMMTLKRPTTPPSVSPSPPPFTLDDLHVGSFPSQNSLLELPPDYVAKGNRIRRDLWWQWISRSFHPDSMCITTSLSTRVGNRVSLVDRNAWPSTQGVVERLMHHQAFVRATMDHHHGRFGTCHHRSSSGGMPPGRFSSRHLFPFSAHKTLSRLDNPFCIRGAHASWTYIGSQRRCVHLPWVTSSVTAWALRTILRVHKHKSGCCSIHPMPIIDDFQTNSSTRWLSSIVVVFVVHPTATMHSQWTGRIPRTYMVDVQQQTIQYIGSHRTPNGSTSWCTSGAGCVDARTAGSRRCHSLVSCGKPR